MSERIHVLKPQPVLVRGRHGNQVIGDEFHEWPAGIIRRKSIFIQDSARQCPYLKPGD